MPQTPTVWARCAGPGQRALVARIEDRLAEEGEQVQIVTTGVDVTRTRRALRRFLTETRPILLLWIGGALDGASVELVEASGIPVVLLDAGSEALASLSGGWFPRRSGAWLAGMTAIRTRDNATADALIRAGARGESVGVSGPLEDGTRILPHSEAERQDIATALKNRPIWLARSVSVDEVPILVAAQRRAARRSHRLLLIATPADPADGAALAEAMRAEGLSTLRRAEGAEPDEAAQVYLADLGGEDGLWLRVAPMGFAGGSLGDGARDDPFEAAALGSVVIHGAASGAHEPRFLRLLRAGASFSVPRAEALGAAVDSLLAADRVAHMAAAGWDVTSSDAGLVSDVVGLIQQALDGAA